jgi:hypothetical protein
MKLIPNLLFGCLLFSLQLAYSQSCPVFDKRNNGVTNGFLSSDVPPAGKVASGIFDFTSGSTSTSYTVDSVYYNGVIYQRGATLVYSGATIWFGGYNGTNKRMCFYGNSNSDNATPAGQWKFFFKNSGTQTTCSLVTNSSGTASSLDPGTIGADQTICSGSIPASLSSSASATGCSSGTPTYQWQYSTTSSNSGYTNAPGTSTSSTYSPASLTQTTYYIRVATCSDGSVASTDPVTITVKSAGTISASPSTWTAPTTTTFSSTGSSGGSWSSSNTSVATIDAASGVLTTQGAGTTTITYTVLTGCTATRLVTITNNSGILPVTWESVSAQKKNGQVFLQWSTASEQNTRDFEIQYSPNTINWNSLGVVQAAGNSSVTKNYFFTHESPLKNNNYNYYRILQRDIDDKSSYSKIVSVIFNEPGDDIMVYPNPADDILTVFLAEEQEVAIINSAGSTVWQSKLPAGKSQVAIHRFSAGVYLLRTSTQTRRFVIK